jgi:hypothetical protein
MLEDGAPSPRALQATPDAFVGQRSSVSGLLIGEGGANGINVSTVNPVRETCPQPCTSGLPAGGSRV